ncbi:MAG: hypothetical protein GY711_33775 [bacterium]|nr:hypothetical protein [bacterium]
MKKLLAKLIILAVVGLALLVVAGVLLFKPAARTAIEGGSNAALGVPTTLEDFAAGLGLTSSSVGIEGFRADNPDGFGDEKFLKVDKLEVEVGTFSLLSDTIEVPKVTLDGLELRLIQDGKRSNFAEVLEHVRQLSSSDEGAAPAADGDSGSSKQIAFGVVDVGTIKTHFDLRGIPGIEDTWDFELPAFRVDFADGDGAAPRTVAQFSAALMDELLQRAVSEAKGHLPPEAAKLLELGRGDVDAKLQELEDKAESVLDDAKDKAKDKLEKGLGGLLNKDE